ncbi:hypothetical protein BUALT_Bualt17G0018100 [Buddleja alternifolia]|uniref:Aspartic peptidase DDI1-type domain-containing protein n=1 Tax=Buddleja alternifolia TaxID=168488 RepID=A0AAV6WD55_9LAMI|nr:hypothetical protein BUALT_Bualt17G0018100 [Buddleja alternifolia]
MLHRVRNLKNLNPRLIGLGRAAFSLVGNIRCMIALKIQQVALSAARNIRCINSLKLLRVIQGKSPNHKGLMYVNITVSGKDVMAMVDMGAAHNFVAEQEIQKLCLNVSEHSSLIKTVNSEVKLIKGITTCRLGGWFSARAV